MESQFLAGINFLHPAFEAVLRRLRFCSQSKYESSSHNNASVCRQNGGCVTSRYRFRPISVTPNLPADQESKCWQSGTWPGNWGKAAMPAVKERHIVCALSFANKSRMRVFRSFRLDPVNQCLWHGGNRVALTPKAFDMLRYLVEHPGRLVTQDEILQALWPETYVNPEIIKKYILEIRNGLGDRHDKPQFIQTFPKRGYQFVAAVSDEVAIGSPDLATAVTKEMVGRDAASAELHHSLQRALHGERRVIFVTGEAGIGDENRSEEHTSELQSHLNLVCRLLLEKKT